MKWIIAGGRHFTDYELLRDSCDKHIKEGIEYVVSGCAIGADSLGERWAYMNGVKTIRKAADWNKHGKSAGPIRNIEMAKIADGLIAFWDGKSRGTQHMIDVATERGLKVIVIKY